MSDRIIPFTYNVKANKQRAFPLFFTVLLVSSVLVVLSMMVEKYSGLVSLGAVVGLTASVMIYQRYITSDYGYVVTDGGEDNAVFLVTKRIGKRSSTMAYLPLYAVTSIQKFTKEELKQHKSDKTAKRYNFAPTFGPDFVYIVFAKTPNGDFELVLECIPEVADRLLEYSRYAKEDEMARRAAEEEEDEEYSDDYADDYSDTNDVSNGE
ncbi:MAG: hypothetical protein IJD79_03145 [Clostridia bacterium]|nr:hypothetical protein [Clostridia bacterium]